MPTPSLKSAILLAFAFALAALSPVAFAAEPAADAKAAAPAKASIKVLIVDGQNNHGNWPQTTKMMKKALEDTGLFAVDVARTAAKGEDPAFKPDFKAYQVVLSNYNGANWPKETQQGLIDFIKGGGGLVVVHAADNAFGNWDEWNKMIGVGGWGGRNEKSGPYIYFKDGKFVRDPSKGNGGSHGKQHPFLITTREPEHPIVKGLPTTWMHSQDELYDRLRGPAENITVLATAFSDPKQGGRGADEPMLMVIQYGKGRVFHTPMGHGNVSHQCSGYLTTLARGAEWAATGAVTQPVPADFPKADAPTLRELDPAKLPEPKLVMGPK